MERLVEPRVRTWWCLTALYEYKLTTMVWKNGKMRELLQGVPVQTFSNMRDFNDAEELRLKGGRK